MNQRNLSMYLLLSLWLGATLFFGGVAPNYERFHLFFASLISLICIWLLGGVEPDKKFKKQNLIAGTVFLFWIIGWVQLIPLPQSILQFFSPLASHLTFDTLDALKLSAEAQNYPITLSPQGNWTFISQFFASSVIFISALLLFRDRKRRRKVAFILCFLGALLALFGLIHRFSGSTKMFWIWEQGWTFFGPYISTNHAGCLFAVLLALGLGLLARPTGPSNRVILTIVLGFTALGLVFTGSRAALLSMGIILILHFWFLSRVGLFSRQALSYTLPVFIIVLLAAFLWHATIFSRLISTPTELITGDEFRPVFWKYALELWQQTPTLGIGFGGFATASRILMDDHVWLHPEHVENDFLEVLVSGGIVTFLLFGLLLFLLLRRIFVILNNPEESFTRKGFALGLVALGVDSVFVFNTPLPAHQILFAILLAGTLSTQRRSVVATPTIRWSLIGMTFAGTVVGLVLALHPAKPKTLAIPETPPPNTSNTDLHAHHLLSLANMEQAVAKNPLNAEALYEFAWNAASLGETYRAQRATEQAILLDRFNLYQRVRMCRIFISGLDSNYGNQVCENIINSPGSIYPKEKLRILLYLAQTAFLHRKEKEYEHYLRRARSISARDFRIPLIEALGALNPSTPIKESWLLAHQNKVSSDLWNQSLVSILRYRKQNMRLEDIAQTMSHIHTDLPTFLAYLERLRPKSQSPIRVRLDEGLASPRFKANNAQTQRNLKYLSTKGSLLVPETIEINVKQSAPTIDALLLPVQLPISQPGLHIEMQIETRHPLQKQFLLEIGGKLHVSPSVPISLGGDKWLFTFPDLWKKKRDFDSSSFMISGIGFTPLEKEGRYKLGPVEVFVESPRNE